MEFSGSQPHGGFRSRSLALRFGGRIPDQMLGSVLNDSQEACTRPRPVQLPPGSRRPDGEVEQHNFGLGFRALQV